MQLMVTVKVSPGFSLPVNYQHILQSVIYDALGREQDYLTKLHDKGYQSGKRVYRLFQFSRLCGKYRIEDKRIFFEDEVSFEVRSVDSHLIVLLAEFFKTNGVRFGEECFPVKDIRIADRQVEAEELRIWMKTPVTVHTTDCISGKTCFVRPDSERFAELVNDNFKRKYKAYTGIEPQEGITLETISFRERDKLVTKYKGFYISGWYGIYRLKGRRKYLDFLYQTGLGARNAQGFGMFEWKEDEG